VKRYGANIIWVGLLAAILFLSRPAGVSRPEGRAGDAAKIIDYAAVVFVINPREEISEAPILMIRGKQYQVVIASGVITKFGILTCYHVVAGKKEDGYLLLYLPQINKVMGAIVVKTEPEYDLAMMELAEACEEIQGAAISKSLPPIGEEITFFGSPARQLLWLRFQRMQRIVAYAGLNEKGELKVVDQPLIPLSPGYAGDSGGGVFNSQGELIGLIQKRDAKMPVVYALPITGRFLKELGWI